MDHVISTYVQSLGALIQSNNLVSEPPAVTECKLLAIIQPNTPNQTELPGANRELKKISRRTSESNTFLRALVGEEATVEQVSRELANYPIVHFACHGVQETLKPLQSRMVLQDGSLTFSQLMHLKLPNAQLAFLSACETAKVNRYIPDEGVHLAACMLAAGFKSTIAATWEIPDSVAPEVADRVYSRLFKDGNFDSSAIAKSLHFALQHLRKRNPDEFVAWVPFIHMSS